MDIGDVGALLALCHDALIGRAAEIRRRGSADGGIEPVVQRHAGASRGGLGPLADGRVDAFNTPRYARIHAFVRLDLGAPPAPSASPRVPVERQSDSAQGVCLRSRLFRVTVNNGLRFRAAEQ